jgi:hypothetical protein
MLLGNQIKKEVKGGICSMHGEKENAHILFKKPEKKTPFGGPTHR